MMPYKTTQARTCRLSSFSHPPCSPTAFFFIPLGAMSRSKPRPSLAISPSNVVSPSRKIVLQTHHRALLALFFVSTAISVANTVSITATVTTTVAVLV